MITLDRDFVRAALPERPDNAHKGAMGTLCSVTGSKGFCGAAVLSAKAALRSGVGLHYQVIPESVYPVFASSVYESVCVPVKGSFVGTVSRADLPAILNTAERASAVLIGCGMGNSSDTLAVLEWIMKGIDKPVIIDADGINALSANINILKERGGATVLTPHVKEFSRLTGLSVEYIIANQAEAAKSFSIDHPDCVLVLKSHRTVIAKNGELYINTAGNSGMAKGGSGDVLAGVIASLCAQGAEPFKAAAAGVHIHALAGDLAAERKGKTAMLPSDIIDCLSDIYRSFE